MTTSIPQIKDVICETGEEVVRDATAEEIAIMEATKAEIDLITSANLEKQALIASRKAKFIALGLTEEELTA